ncbi:MAG: hypothetical protein HY673_15780 [Chloroflexi bacterium]|nr:hypothetical protein [Chloroflexota bacterium]
MPSPDDMVWRLVGMAGAALTTFAYIPQIVKVWRHRSARSLSLQSLVQLSVGVFFWMVYGLYLRDPIIAGANFITLVSLLVLTVLYLVYRKR